MNEVELRVHLIDRIQRDRRPTHYVLVDCTTQRLQLCSGEKILQTFIISSAKNGLGTVNGSFKTPPGLHEVSAVIGAGAAEGLLFKGRIAQPLCAEIEHRAVSTGVDTITSRILRLNGLEAGLNQGGDCDSFARYIYIHGTAEEGLLGQAVSQGCVRMANADVMLLASQLAPRALVHIR